MAHKHFCLKCNAVVAEGDFERDADRTMNERLRIQCQVRVCASIQSADAFARDRHLAQSSKSCSAS
jgi:hypothetical protein